MCGGGEGGGPGAAGRLARGEGGRRARAPPHTRTPACAHIHTCTTTNSTHTPHTHTHSTRRAHTQHTAQTAHTAHTHLLLVVQQLRQRPHERVELRRGVEPVWRRAQLAPLLQRLVHPAVAAGQRLRAHVLRAAEHVHLHLRFCWRGAVVGGGRRAAGRSAAACSTQADPLPCAAQQGPTAADEGSGSMRYNIQACCAQAALRRWLGRAHGAQRGGGCAAVMPVLPRRDLRARPPLPKTLHTSLTRSAKVWNLWRFLRCLGACGPLSPSLSLDISGIHL